MFKDTHGKTTIVITTWQHLTITCKILNIALNVLGKSETYVLQKHNKLLIILLVTPTHFSNVCIFAQLDLSLTSNATMLIKLWIYLPKIVTK